MQLTRNPTSCEHHGLISEGILEEKMCSFRCIFAHNDIFIYTLISNQIKVINVASNDCLEKVQLVLLFLSGCFCCASTSIRCQPNQVLLRERSLNVFV